MKSLKEMQEEKRELSLAIKKLKFGEMYANKQHHRALSAKIAELRRQNSIILNSAYQKWNIDAYHFCTSFDANDTTWTGKYRVEMNRPTVAWMAFKLGIAHTQFNRMLHGKAPIKEPHLSILNKLFSIQLQDETKLNETNTQELAQDLQDYI